MPAAQPIRSGFAVLASLVFFACQGANPVDSPDGEPALAKGGGSAIDPTVTVTDPTSAPQDTILDVRVFGTGYDRGSKVDLLLAGQPVTKVRTNSTRFVSTTELVANITIDLDAVVASYDVSVTTATGRKGIGTELFAVRIKGNTDLDSHANWTFYSTMSNGTTPTRLYGDGRGLNGATSPTSGESAYPGETCGVRGKLFNSITSNNSGDAVFDPDFTPDGSACGKRAIRAEFTVGSPVTLTPFTNARQVWSMGPGETRTQPMWFSNGGALPCGVMNTMLRYELERGGGVMVTRLADQSGARVWRVETTGTHEVSCYKTSGKTPVFVSLHYLPLHAVIVEVPAPAGGW